MSRRDTTYWGDPPAKPIAEEDRPLPAYLYTALYLGLVFLGMGALSLLQAFGVLH